MDTNEGILRFYQPYFDFIEKLVANGKNVLVHCLAGAHRAGTAGCSWLIFKENYSVENAIKIA